MRSRRLTDYAGPVIWFFGLVFLGGGVYKTNADHEKAIAGLEAREAADNKANIALASRVTTLEANQANQMAWQHSILSTLEAMRKEIKDNNERGIRIETKVESIGKKLNY